MEEKWKKRDMYTADEIKLKELLIVLMDGRKIMGVTVAIVISLTMLVSVFVLDKSYESSTTLLVSNASSRPVTIDGITSGVEGLVDTLSGNIPQTITTYKEQMITTDMMIRVINKLGLSDIYSPANFLNMISVSNIKETNLLEVIVRANDPQLAADIANELASEFSSFIAEINSERLAKSSSFLQLKVIEEKAKLDDALLEYKEFLVNSPGTKIIEAEIQSKSARLNDLKSELDGLEPAFSRNVLAIESSVNEKKSRN